MIGLHANSTALELWEPWLLAADNHVSLMDRGRMYDREMDDEQKRGMQSERVTTNRKFVWMRNSERGREERANTKSIHGKRRVRDEPLLRARTRKTGVNTTDG